jgi:hypothetical protein
MFSPCWPFLGVGRFCDFGLAALSAQKTATDPKPLFKNLCGQHSITTIDMNDGFEGYSVAMASQL